MNGTVSVGDAITAAQHAKESVRLVRKWLPVDDQPGDASKKWIGVHTGNVAHQILQFWNPKTFDDVIEIHTHKGRKEPGLLDGSNAAMVAMLELNDAMRELASHIGFGDRKTKRVKPISGELLLRIESAADEIIGTEGDHDDHKELANWRSDSSLSKGDQEIMQALETLNSRLPDAWFTSAQITKLAGGDASYMRRRATKKLSSYLESSDSGYRPRIRGGNTEVTQR